jgi:hypothetical protein
VSGSGEIFLSGLNARTTSDLDAPREPGRLAVAHPGGILASTDGTG